MSRIRSGFRFVARENSPIEWVVVTDPWDEQVVIVRVGNEGVMCNQARVASVAKLERGIQAEGALVLESLEPKQVDDIRRTLLQSNETRQEPRELLAPLPF